MGNAKRWMHEAQQLRLLFAVANDIFYCLYFVLSVFQTHSYGTRVQLCKRYHLQCAPNEIKCPPPPTALSVIVLMDCNEMWYSNREIWKKRRRVWRRGKGIVPCRPIARKENEHSSSQCNKLTKHYIWNLSTTDMFSSFPCDHKEQFVVALARPHVVCPGSGHLLQPFIALM